MAVVPAGDSVLIPSLAPRSHSQLLLKSQKSLSPPTTKALMPRLLLTAKTTQRLTTPPPPRPD